MEKLESTWYDVKYFLPGTEVEWCVVRCINEDIDDDPELDFYFMALYSHERKSWLFFDGKDEEEMQVTHWTPTIKVTSEHEFIKSKD